MDGSHGTSKKSENQFWYITVPLKKKSKNQFWYISKGQEPVK
jgi:hypothetical protein